MMKIPFLLTVIACCVLQAQAQVKLGVGTPKKKVFDLSYTNPKEYEIANIEVSGVESLDKNALISISGLAVGDKIKIPGETVSGAITKMWNHGIIGDAALYVSKVEGAKVWLRMELTERPRLLNYDLEGINKTHENEIIDKIDLIRGRVVTDALISDAETLIKRHFVEKGFLNAEVSTVKKKDTTRGNGVRLVFQVNKKSKIRIDNITVHGNTKFRDNVVVNKMKKTKAKVRFHLIEDLFRTLFRTNKKSLQAFFTKKREYTSDSLMDYINSTVKLNFFNSSKFIRSEYRDDKNLITDFYNSKGHRDARIIKDSVHFADNNSINIDLWVNEGVKYYIRNIDWTGNYIYSDNVLRKVFGFKEGDIYDLDLINKKLNFNPNGADVSSLYLDNGYLFFSVRPIEVAVTEDSIDLEMRVHEGEQATINQVIVRGNTRTNDHVIYREIRTKPGQKFNRSELIRTQRELSTLGFFDPEQIGINPIPNPADATVDIEYTLVEKGSDQVQVSGGWGGPIGFIGTLGVTFSNFSIKNIPHFDKWRPLPIGDGQKLSFSLQANGLAHQNYSFSFTEPWLGGKKPNSFTVSFNRSISRLRANQTLNNSFDVSFIGSLKLTGVSIGLGRRLKWPDDYFVMSNVFSYKLYELDNYTYGGSSFGFTTGNASNISFTVALSRNSIDNPLYSRSGSSISLNATFTPPYSLLDNKDYNTIASSERYKWVEYHKWMFDASYFMQVVGDLVLNTRTHFGILGAYSSERGIGPFERFNLGGSGLAGLGGSNFFLGTDIIGLRGYPEQSLFPVDDEGFRGGALFNKFVMELRYPVTTSQAATIYGLVFAEGGNNWAEYREVNPFQLKKSAGLGARIFMPTFGMIGFDWAYGFDSYQPFNGFEVPVSGGRFHFTIGQQIR